MGLNLSRARRSRTRGAAAKATLVDYRPSGLGFEQLDHYYELIGYPRQMPAANYVHLSGILDDEVVLIGLWSSDRKARTAYATARTNVRKVLDKAGPGAAVDRQSYPVRRFVLGDEIGDFRQDRARTGPDCAAYVIDLPATDGRAYDLICEQMNFPGDYPEGLMLHVAGRVDDVWRVISVWREARQSREFFERRLMPAAVEVVREHQVFPAIHPRELRVHLFAVNKRLT